MPKLSQLPEKACFSTLTASLGAFAGLLGSIYASEIKNAFPFVWGDGPFVWQAALFWFSLFLFGWFFGLGFRAQHQATNQLRQLIRTLPPKDFLADFEDLFRASFAVDAEASKGQDDSGRLKESIRTALYGVAVLASKFDARTDHPRYSINIMLFRRIQDVTSEELQNHLLFTEPGQGRDAWDGVLQLQTEFAYSMINGELKEDKTLPPIMLPIPKSDHRIDNGKSTILPGAPTVFCDPRNHAGFENTLQLATWCRDHSGLRVSVSEKVQRYFTDGSGKEIRSFICVPILSPGSTPGAAPEVLGVLNLHSNKEGLLPGERAGLFAPLTAPFTLLIARSLAKYSLLPKAKGSA